VKKRVAFKTLGCRLNQYETDAIVSDFYRNDYEIVSFNHDADVYIINTCTVTNQSDHKSRNFISQAIRKADGSLVVVTGCMVNNHKKSLEQQENISYVVENDQKSSVFNLVDSHLNGEITESNNYRKDKFGFGIADKGFHTRAMIKIQDGCDNFCSFCIVPKVRGRAVSRSLKKIEENIRIVIDLGFKEVVLTGVNIGRYDFEGLNFEGLVSRILNIQGEFRVRISSIEPDGFSNRFFELFEHPKLTPHLHLCLQSGSKKILEKMRRMYSVQTFVKMTENLKSQNPDFNLTTDIIVGFPGETEKDFEDTIRICHEIGFSHIHTFKYSIRQGTLAARLEDQIPEKVKNIRSEIIRNISLNNKLKYFKGMVDKEQTVLTERSRKGLVKGYGENYIPVTINGNIPGNSFQKIKLTGIIGDNEPEMTGEISE
jgi:threonylcarbamoyladenosine tRNA methylthiotransferase MtaB